MKRTGLLLLTAAPGLAAGYLILTGYLMNRIKPIPIALLPDSAPTRSGASHPVTA